MQVLDLSVSSERLSPPPTSAAFAITGQPVALSSAISFCQMTSLASCWITVVGTSSMAAMVFVI